MVDAVYRSRAEFPDTVVMQDGHAIKISGHARWLVEMELSVARLGYQGTARCSRLQNDYYAMGKRLLMRAEEARDDRKAWLTYWGNRHIEIANGFFEALSEQSDFAQWAEAEDG